MKSLAVRDFELQKTTILKCEFVHVTRRVAMDSVLLSERGRSFDSFANFDAGFRCRRKVWLRPNHEN